MKRKFEFSGIFINKTDFKKTVFKYNIPKNVFKVQKGTCIVVPNLNPDFVIVLGKVRLIICQRGSDLSHLAIVAREFNIPIIRINENFFSSIPEKGNVEINISGDGTVKVNFY